MAWFWKDANEKTPVRRGKVGPREVREKKKTEGSYRSQRKGGEDEQNEQEKNDDGLSFVSEGALPEICLNPTLS